MEKVLSLCFRISSGLNWDSLKSSDYSFVFEDSYMKVKFSKPIEYDEKYFLEIENKIRAAYFVQQIFDDQKYKLEYAGFEVQFHGTAHMIYWASPSTVRQEHIHDIVSAQTGKIVFDFEKESKFREQWHEIILQVINEEPEISGLVKSFEDAIANHENEFVYLFEVLDALEKRFKKIHKACSELDLDRRRWNSVTDTLNNREYYQSRHRGQAFGGTKWAPSEKIWDARNFTKEAIIKYILFIRNGKIEK